MKIKNDVLIGKEGYLFLWGGRQREFSYLTGREVPDHSSIAAFRKNIEARNRFANELGIEYCHLVFPTKAMLKGDYLPDGMKLDSLYLSHFYTDSVIYPQAAVADMERSRSTFRVLDTHMTDAGSLAIVKVLFGELYQAFLDSGGVYAERHVKYSGDLANMAGIEAAVDEITLEPLTFGGGKISHREVNNFKQLKSNGGGVSITYCPDSISPKRLLVFGDSFFVALLPLLRPLFREIFYIRSEALKKELVYLYKPDVVVTANAERYLSRVLPDQESGFLFFDDMRKSFYASSEGPDDKFLGTLRGVLSKEYDKVAYQAFERAQTIGALYARYEFHKKCKMARSALDDLALLKVLKPGSTGVAELIRAAHLESELPLTSGAQWTVQEVQRFASGIFKFNIRLADVFTNVEVETRSVKSVGDGVRLIEKCLEVISFHKRHVNWADESRIRILFNRVAIISRLISAFDQIVPELRRRLGDPLVVCLYRLLLACYQCKAAWIVSRPEAGQSCILAGSDPVRQSFFDLLAGSDFSADNQLQKLVSCGIPKPDRDRVRAQYNILTGLDSVLGGDHEAKNRRFREYVEGKAVAIVGPADSSDPTGEEIDGFDVVVRLSYVSPEKSIADPVIFGSKTDVSYFSAHIRFFPEEILAISEKLAFVCVTYPKYAPDLLLKDNIREAVGVEPCFTGKVNLIQAAALEIAACRPKRLKIFCANLFMSKSPYNTSYPSTDMLNAVAKVSNHRGLNSITFTNHDPINNFLIMKFLHSRQVIEVDSQLSGVLSLSVGEYMSNLQEIFE